jgi:hypothetical protein
MNNNSTPTPKPLLDKQASDSFQSMYIFNDNLRKNIRLSLAIYKKINNFEHNYIHKIFNDKTEKST